MHYNFKGSFMQNGRTTSWKENHNQYFWTSIFFRAIWRVLSRSWQFWGESWDQLMTWTCLCTPPHSHSCSSQSNPTSRRVFVHVCVCVCVCVSVLGSVFVCSGVFVHSHRCWSQADRTSGWKHHVLVDNLGACDYCLVTFYFPGECLLPCLT